MISSQSDGSKVVKQIDDTDLFQEDVSLISKDGKVFLV